MREIGTLLGITGMYSIYRVMFYMYSYIYLYTCGKSASPVDDVRKK